MSSFHPLEPLQFHIAAKTRIAKGMTAKHAQVSISREKSATASLQKKMAKSGEAKIKPDIAVRVAMMIILALCMSIRVLL